MAYFFRTWMKADIKNAHYYNLHILSLNASFSLTDKLACYYYWPILATLILHCCW